MLPVTFDQETAAEDPKAVHLSVTHPLVRQAARFLQLDEPACALLAVCTNDAPPGDHPFALYRWKLHGVRSDEVLISVAATPAVEDTLLKLLERATDANPPSAPPQAEMDALDAKHHAKWTAAQANHIAQNRQLVEHRIQSLTVSHRARCAIIQAQIHRATNDKIRLMRTSELARANADYARRMDELQKAAGGGDIHASPVLFGTIAVRKENPT
jgi:hypothetical protein